MKSACHPWLALLFALPGSILAAAPVIDPLPNVGVPVGKTLTIPITASSPSGRPLTFTFTSSTNRLTIEQHTNNPFWKMSIAQVAPANAPGAYPTPFRGGLATVTNMGDMTLMLFRDRAPHTVDVFTGFSSSGFYNSNTIFHRVIPGFVIQGGDPATNGSGGPVFRYDDEFHPRAIFSGNGQLALANSGKDTDGSQFFITLGKPRHLDFGYTLFGQLLRGFNVASNVINTPRTGIGTIDRPIADVIITRTSLVTNTTDTVITLSGTTLAGVSGTIHVIADDGLPGGRVTNSFTATTIPETTNAEAFLKTPAITNRFLTSGIRYTNYIQAQDLEGNTRYYSARFYDAVTQNNATSATIFADGGLAFTVAPGYAGPLSFYVYVSQWSDFTTVTREYDVQLVTFAVGDTGIFPAPINFIASPLLSFTDQVLATFTNGIPNSSPAGFTAAINWGDNSTNAGAIVTNLAGAKEIRGSHTYTNSGHYPIYITIRSLLGAEATVISTAYVPPSVGLTRTGPGNVLRWPAWATDYQLQFQTNLAASTWTTVTNLPRLEGYDTVVTNASTEANEFFRLKR